MSFSNRHKSPLSRPIRVLEVTTQLTGGGASLCVITLATQLRSPHLPDFQSLIISGLVGAKEADMRYLADAQHVPIVTFRWLGRSLSIWRDFLTLVQLVTFFRHERPDVIHTHTSKAGFLGRLAGRIAGVSVLVHTFHGHIFQGHFNPQMTWFFLTLERLSAHLSDRIIAPSTELKRQLIYDYHICASDRIVVIENGIDLTPLLALPPHSGDFRAIYSIPPDVPLIGIIGRLVPIKNHDLFFQAAKGVIEQFPNAHFAVVGNGERSAELVALVASLGMTKRTHFTGWVNDMLPVYSALDCVVLCSQNEGHPISLIEAMAAGIPVVATNVGGVSDLLSNPRFGGLVQPGDTAELVRAIVAALNGQYDLEAAREYICQCCDSHIMSKRTADLYYELLARKGQLPIGL